NRTAARVDQFLAGRAKGKRIIGTHSVKELVAALKRPRKVMLMVKAGPAVDQVIEEVVPYLEPGDILIDGGNTHFPDTTRRTRALKPGASSTPAPGCRGARGGRSRAPRSCRGAPPTPGRTSSRSSRRSRPRRPTARPAATGSAPRGRAITSRWST